MNAVMEQPRESNPYLAKKLESRASALQVFGNILLVLGLIFLLMATASALDAFGGDDYRYWPLLACLAGGCISSAFCLHVLGQLVRIRAALER